MPPDKRPARGDISSYLFHKWVGRLRERQRPPEEPTGHWASNLGHPCLFALWAQRARWADQATPEDTLLSIFDLGDFYEEFAKEKVRDSGIKVFSSQVLIADEELNIRGRSDFRVRTDDVEAPEHLKRRHGVIAEIKGINDSDWQSIDCVDAMLESRKPWVRKWPHQLAFYVDKSGEDVGVFVFVSKITGVPKTIELWVEDWRPLLEDAYYRISRVNGYLKLGREAPPLVYDPVFCGRCNWAHICATAATMTGTGEAVTMKSEHLDKQLANVSRHEVEGKAYTSGRDSVKKMLDDTAGAWPKEGITRTLITDAYTLLLETKGGRHYWSVKTKRGG